MNQQPLYKTVLAQTIIAALRKENIEVSVRTAIDISKILSATDLTVFGTFSSLKYRLSPVISRNKEEQEIIHKIFDNLDKKIKNEDYIEPPLSSSSPVATIVPGTSVYKKTVKKIRRLSLWKKAFLILSLAGMVALIIYYFQPVPVRDSFFVEISMPRIINEPVIFMAKGDSSSLLNTRVDWQFEDTLIANTLKVQRTFVKEGARKFTAHFKNGQNKVIKTVEGTFTVLCELPPEIAIKPVSDTKNNSKRIGYIAAGTNYKKPGNYKYKWYSNGVLVSRDMLYEYVRPANQYNSIRLVVDTRNIHCSADSLVAEYKESPALTATITGDGALQIDSPANWKNIALSFLWLVAVPIIPVYALYLLFKRRPAAVKKSEIIEGKPGEEGPYAIEFADHDNTISTEPSMKMLADTLRKRQVSDVFKLSIRKTITATIRSGGMPQLNYVPLTRPTDYLVFIDKEDDGGHLTRLYEYLINRLRKEQVYITVYEYHKEPLYLSNQKLNHNKLPIERIAALYPNMTLFIFGDSRHFIFPLKGTLKTWVSSKLNTWKNRIFITSYTKKDWDRKELMLANAGFTIIPADLSAQPAIDKIVNRQVEPEDQHKLDIPAEYSFRYLDLQNFNTLQIYLNDTNLLSWVCSLAVYSVIDWNLTLAIGKALEERLRQENKLFELVNYSNLLKLSRISWMRDGVISDSLRIEMLQYLDNETEALARKTLLALLQPLKESITSNSIIKRTFDVNEKINNLLLDAFEGRKPSNDAKIALGEMIARGHMNLAEEVYLNKADNTLLKDPSNRNRSVRPDVYLKPSSLRENLLFPAMALLVFIIGIILSWNILNRKTNLLEWKRPEPVDQRFIIRLGDNITDSLIGSVSRDNKWVTRMPLKTENISTQSLLLNDTSQTAEFALETPGGQTIYQAPFKLNSREYIITITPPIPVPLKIIYKNASDLELAKIISQNLPANVNDTIYQQQFPDTGIHIYYSTDRRNFASDARLLSKAVNQGTGLTVPAQVRDPDTGSNLSIGIYLYINIQKPCTPIALTALPSSLREIWKGGTSNRLINIDATRKVIYYSTGNKKDYGTYSMDDICLLQNGTLKLITRTNQGYKVFFIKNITAQSFELSVCQNLYKTKEEINTVDESYCDRFNVMSLYYEPDNTRIYIPADGKTYFDSERRKMTTLIGTQGRLAAGLETIDSLKAYINPRNNTSVDGRLKVIRQSSLLSKYSGNVWYSSTYSDNPFDRDYITVSTRPVNNDDKPVTESDLGLITFSGGSPDQNGQLLLQRISNELRKNGTSRIKIEGTYYIESQLKTLESNISTVKNILYKYGINEKSGQLSETLASKTGQANQQQTQQKKENSIPESEIRIKGINFKESNNKSSKY